MRRGDSGPAVADLQSALSAAGYPLVVDGRFGRMTEIAVRKFQENASLTVDGIAGSRTRSALRSRLSFVGRLRLWWTRVRAWLIRN